VKPVSVLRQFNAHLRGIAALNWVSRVLRIPVDLANATLFSLVVTSALAGQVSAVLGYALILLALTLVSQGVFSWLGGVISRRGGRAEHRCKMLLYWVFLRSPLHKLFCATGGDTLEHLTDDFHALTSVSTSLYPSLVVGGMTLVCYGFFLGRQSLGIALALLGISLVQIVPMIVVRRYLEKNYEDNREVEARLTDFTVSGYEGLATIKLFGLRSWYLTRMRALHTDYYRVGRRSELTASSQQAMESLVGKILQYGMYFIIGAFILYGDATVEVGIQAIALAGGLFGAAMTIFDCLPQFALARKARHRVQPWFDDAPDTALPADAAIEVRALSHGYDERLVLEALSHHFPPCSRTQIVGENGAGKTTLLRLLVGLLQPQGGQVLVGGVAAEALDAAVWQKTLAYVPQEDAEYDLTAEQLREMTSIDKAAANKAFAAFALNEAQIEDTQISELSGGERKKVFLSLAFARDPEILLLDEPSNSLDASAKRVLREWVRDFSGTLIVISHEALFDGLVERVVLAAGEGKHESD